MYKSDNTNNSPTTFAICLINSCFIEAIFQKKKRKREGRIKEKNEKNTEKKKKFLLSNSIF